MRIRAGQKRKSSNVYLQPLKALFTISRPVSGIVLASSSFLGPPVLARLAVTGRHLDSCVWGSGCSLHV